MKYILLILVGLVGVWVGRKLAVKRKLAARKKQAEETGNKQILV